MTEPIIYLTYPDGWVKISAQYLVRSMPMYDLDSIIDNVFKRCDDELMKLDAFLIVLDLMRDYALKGLINQRRFWMIIKRFKRLGYAPDWNAERVTKWFYEHAKDIKEVKA